MLEPGNNIFITARIEERRYQQGSLQIKILDIFLLSETMAKLAKAILLNISVTEINDKISSEILELTNANPGDTPLQVRLTDPDNNVNILLKSVSTKVNPRLFVKELLERSKINYSIV